jgi:hypothetical protein
MTWQFAVPVVLRLCDDGSKIARSSWVRVVEKVGRTVQY